MSANLITGFQFGNMQFGTEVDSDSEQYEKNKKLRKLIKRVMILSILQIVFSFLAEIGKESIIYYIGCISEALFGVISAITLLKLSSKSSCFKSAGICLFIVSIGNVVVDIIAENDLLLIFSAIIFTLRILTYYNEINGYIDILSCLSGRSEKLTNHWNDLWDVYVAAYAFYVVGYTFLGRIFPGIGMFCLMGACMCLIFFYVVRIIKLKETADMV